MKKKFYFVVTKILKNNKVYITKIYQRRNFAQDLARKLKRYYSYGTDVEIHVIEREVDIDVN